MKFVSRKHAGLRVVLDPRMRQRIQGRTITGSLTGDTALGLTIEFRDHVYETNDKKIIELIKNHTKYGLDFYPMAGEEKVEPTKEAIVEENEKAEYREELASTCPECGEKFKSEAAVNGHMRVHQK